MIQLEVGKTYSTKELYEAIGASKDQWKRKKNEYLKQLSMAYEYDIEYKGRSVLYTITEQKGEYQKPERKNAREKVDAVIKEFINKVIDEDPMQTAANINRRAWEHSDTNPSTIVLLGLKDTTTGEYIRLNLREMYGTQIGNGGTDGMIEKKVWCRLDAEYNCYVEMPKEMIDKFFACFDEAREEQKQIDLSVCADYENRLITREEMNEKLGDSTFNAYREGKQLFYERHGYYPIKVPVYMKNAWVDADKAYKVYGGYNNMAEKSFQLLKNLIITYIQGAGAVVADEREMAKELYCEINGYEVERFNELWREAIETLEELFPFGCPSNTWKIYRIHLSTLIDNIDEQLREEKAR